MANHAYARFWCRDFSEVNMLDLFERFLGAAPFSPSLPGFHSLEIRAVEAAETPLAEHDMRLRPATAAEVIAVCREHSGDDLLYAVSACWDVWAFDNGTGRDRPQPIELSCWGENFDSGAFTESGHFQLDAGFEHLFTGHAGLLAPREAAAGAVAVAPDAQLENARAGAAVAAHPAEAQFLRLMSDPARLRDYHEKTRENISRLLRCTEQLKEALPSERYALWSEGEENFEARLDDILAAR